MTNPLPNNPQNNPNVPVKLSNLPLRPSTLSLLLRKGFTTTHDIQQSKSDGGISNFASELFGHDANNNLKEAWRIVKEVEECYKSLFSSCQEKKKRSMTAASILQATSTPSSGPRHIITFCRTIDSLLGGGFARSEVTELVGVPSIGKTQFAMQLCVDAKLPRIYGGVEGEAVFVDSEGSFSAERCWSMANALVKHVHASAARRRSRHSTGGGGGGGGGGSGVPRWFSPEGILSGIHVFRVHDETSQNCTIHYLEEFIKKRKQECENGGGEGEEGKKIAPIKLVVIDSIAFHYRSSLSGADYKARTRSLSEIASFLSRLATTFDIAVVVINQMTTKVGGGAAAAADMMGGMGGGGTGNSNTVDLNNESTKLIPALGESWAHATTTRLLLDFMPSGSRCCRLIKSPHKAAGTALYDVTENGIRDVPPSSIPRQRGEMATDVSKRSRTHY